MLRAFAFGWGVLLILTGSAWALQAVGTLRKVDAQAGVVIVFANGQDRTLTVEAGSKFLDAHGKELADGLKAKELAVGAEVTVTVERVNNRVIFKALQLGRTAGAGEGAPRGSLAP